MEDRGDGVVELASRVFVYKTLVIHSVVGEVVDETLIAPFKLSLNKGSRHVTFHSKLPKYSAVTALVKI